MKLMANSPKVMGFSGALAAAVILAASFEGLHHTTYLDPPGIPTICYGHAAKDVHLGQKANDEECIRFLKEDLLHANAIIDRYVKVSLTQERRAALLDFIFNIGEGNFARSTLLKKLNSGDNEGACGELKRWTKSGGIILHGLEKRREAEYNLCIEGIKK